MKVVAPCKECKRKGCGSYHSQCPEYLKYKEQIKQEQEGRREFIRIYSGRVK